MNELPPHTNPTPGDTVEQQLRLAEQQVAFHVANTPLAVVVWDYDLRITRWNAQAERIFGWSADEVIGLALLDCPFIAPQNRELAERMMREGMSGQQIRSVVTIVNCTKSRGSIWCEWYSSNAYDESGRFTSALALALDVTERRLTAEALAQSQARVRAALDGARMLAWDLDLAANRWETTTALADFYGLEVDPDDGNPQTALRAVHPDDLPAVLAGRQRAIETDEPMRYEFRGRQPGADGRTRWYSTSGRVLRDDAGRAVRIVAITTDVTDRKRAEAEREELDRQLREAQRWESLGVLAGGVAHDFNNILTVIQGCAELTRREVLSGSPAVAHLDQIEQACQRAAGVCRQMLAYAGHTRSTGGHTDLAALIRESIPLLEISAGSATMRLDLAENLPPLPVAPAQVQQVLMSLVTNAAEAIGQATGDVTISARVIEVMADTPDGGFQLVPAPGLHLVLTVMDTGYGMLADVRARMFDPFFTTKFPGRGLGLAAVLGIVRAHAGGLHVATTPGRGTRVSVYWSLRGATREVAQP